jgi:hypothetical protein
VPIIAQTNQFYVTEEIHTKAVFSPTSEQIEHAKQAKDSRPAKDDPDGNWGPIAEGFQLSIRLQKNRFSNGEPIVAAILLRNVSDKALTYFESGPYDTDQKLVLSRDGKKLLGTDEITTNMTFKEKLSHIHNGRRWNSQLAVGTQRKFIVALTNYFDLQTNGVYSIQVRRIIPKFDLTSETEVVSKSATFQIINR